MYVRTSNDRRSIGTGTYSTLTAASLRRLAFQATRNKKSDNYVSEISGDEVDLEVGCDGCTLYGLLDDISGEIYAIKAEVSVKYHSDTIYQVTKYALLDYERLVDGDD